jgi:hypothetical protein
MGFLDGFLGGVVQQRNTIEQQSREDAQQSQAREDAILQHLLTSDDPEIKAHAVAGILESTKPKKRKGGFSGWLGEMKNNPQMDNIRALIAQDQAVGHHVPTEVAKQAGVHMASGDPHTAVATVTAAAAGSPAGSPHTGSAGDAISAGADKPPVNLITRAAPAAAGAAPSPGGSGSLAQTGEKSLTEVGAPPPAATEPTPSPDQPAPPVRPEMFSGASPAAVLGQAAPAGPAPAAAVAPATVRPTTLPSDAPDAAGPGPQASPLAAADVGPGSPPPATPGPTGAVTPATVLGKATPPPVGAGPLSPRGDVFRTPETQIRKSKTAQAQGDVEGQMAGLVSAGFTEPEARSIIKERMGRGTRAGAASGYQSTAGQTVDPDTGEVTKTFGAFDRTKGQYIGTDPDSPFYGIPIPGFQPRATGSSQTPEEAAAKAKAVTLARGQAGASTPMTPQQKFVATDKLAGEWQKIQAPVREMQRQHQLMVTGLERFRQGDTNGGSQAVLVTFQKILDPTSVVRESEYARSAQGLGLATRLEGFMQRLKEGGAGVPDAELAAMVETGRQFLDGMKGWNDQQKDRISQQAKANQLDPNQIFGQPTDVGTPPPASVSAMPAAGAPPAAGTPPPPAAATPGAPAPITPPVGVPRAPSATPKPGQQASSKLDQPAKGVFVDASGNLVYR